MARQNQKVSVDNAWSTYLWVEWWFDGSHFQFIRQVLHIKTNKQNKKEKCNFVLRVCNPLKIHNPRD